VILQNYKKSLQRYVFFEKKERKVWRNERKTILLQAESNKKDNKDDKNGKFLVVAQLKIRTIVRR
jgi:hypothetical protein